MKFFAKQKVDLVGITAVTLQKILLFLMILSLFTIFNGGFFSFLLCLIGFLGAFKRSTGLLTTYVSISVVLIVLCSIVAISSIFMGSTGDYVYDSSSSSANSGDYVHGQGPRSFAATLARKLYTIGSESSSQSSSESSSQISSDDVASSAPNNNPPEASYSYYSSSSSSYVEDTGIIFLLVVVMILAFFLAYLKVYSLVLAWRLRKMIILAANVLPTTEAPQQTHEFVPANTSCAVPENDSEVPRPPVSPFQPAPMFAPGFAPYPYGMPMMMPQGQQYPGQQYPGQFPHHVMFGQQPVFYTYAPVNPTPSDEKL